MHRGIDIKNNWFRSIKEKQNSKLRLFCFHYSGGSASVFNGWSKDISNDVDLFALQLPGRENRFGEELLYSLDSVIASIYEAFKCFLDKPFIFFGHSLGAILAFELIKVLERYKIDGIRHFITSGCRAPQMPSRRGAIHNLPDSELLEVIKSYNGIHKDVFKQDRFIKEVMLPMIRADFAISDQYTYNIGEKIKCPILSLGGSSDNVVNRKEILGWRSQSNLFDYKFFQGDHFFIKSSYTQVIKAINLILSKYI